MTTLSKEDVVRWAREAGCNIITTPDDVVARYNDVRVTNMLGRFAEAARADLVAENERLKGVNNKICEAARDEYQKQCHNYEQLTATQTALAAAEADNERLRNHLSAIPDCMYRDNAREIVRQALSQPRNDSALRKMIAERTKEATEIDYFRVQKVANYYLIDYNKLSAAINAYITRSLD